MRPRSILVASLVAVLLCAGVAAPVAAQGSPTVDGTTQQQTATADACSFPVELTDASGETLRLEERPERVTTTNPSAAQTMWEIGGREQVVGVTRYASYLKGADSRTDVSSEFGVSIEKVRGTQPDLVLVPNSTNAEQLEDLRDKNLPVFHLPRAHSIEDIAAKTTTIGRLTGNCEGAAATNVWMNERVEEAQLSVDDGDRPTILYPLGSGYVAAGDTFIDEMLSVAGAENVAARNHTGYPQLSPEVVLQFDPEYILITDRDTDIVDEEPYASTTAGQEGNTIHVDVQWVNQPAPRSVVYTVENVSAQLEAAEATSEPVETEGSAVSTEATAVPTDATTTTAGDDGEGDDEGGSSGVGAPGFGPAVAAIALLVTALVARLQSGRRRS
ncbi:iron complex transport system substrate-binding protein [Halopenitus malekzadehii]|uniref:Iron complex transport system substrate-binding protein n=1 Tax=Halopenitus malekzadehii TaxID=1267564 RepID=A0A1H6HXX5_9EURY|nr:PGF-CTERM-anchored ABC transporter substrate-binding protein [Halopenitus malekzadehii]SEH40559.1 iron complex transport system substrate-binding protein [Halopenitus malekzadehii]